MLSTTNLYIICHSMTIILNVGIVLIHSDSKVTIYSNKGRSRAHHFITCGYCLLNTCEFRITSTTLSTHDEKEVMGAVIAELSGVYNVQKKPVVDGVIIQGSYATTRNHTKDA